MQQAPQTPWLAKWTSEISWKFVEDIPTNLKKKENKKGSEDKEIKKQNTHKYTMGQTVHNSMNHITLVTQVPVYTQALYTFQDTLSPWMASKHQFSPHNASKLWTRPGAYCASVSPSPVLGSPDRLKYTWLTSTTLLSYEYRSKFFLVAVLPQRVPPTSACHKGVLIILNS